MLKCEGGCHRYVDEYYFMPGGEIFCYDCWREGRSRAARREEDAYRNYRQFNARKEQMAKESERINDELNALRIKIEAEIAQAGRTTRYPDKVEDYRDSNDIPYNYSTVKSLEADERILRKQLESLREKCGENNPFFPPTNNGIDYGNARWIGKKDSTDFERYEYQKLKADARRKKEETEREKRQKLEEERLKAERKEAEQREFERQQENYRRNIRIQIDTQEKISRIREHDFGDEPEKSKKGCFKFFVVLLFIAISGTLIYYYLEQSARSANNQNKENLSTDSQYEYTSEGTIETSGETESDIQNDLASVNYYFPEYTSMFSSNDEGESIQLFFYSDGECRMIDNNLLGYIELSGRYVIENDYIYINWNDETSDNINLSNFEFSRNGMHLNVMQ